MMAGPRTISEALQSQAWCWAGKMRTAGSSSGISLYASVVSPAGLSSMGASG